MLLTRAAERSYSTSLSPHYASVDLFKKLPAWTAGKAEIQESNMHRYSIYFAKYEAVCLALAYLYKACIHAGVLSRKWPDMDWFLEQHSKRKPFVREVACGGEMVAWLRHLQIAMGESPAIFASNTRYKSPDDPMRKTRPSASRMTMVESPSELDRIGDEVSARGVSRFHKSYTYNVLHTLSEDVEASGKSKGKKDRHNTGFSAAQLLLNFKKVRMAEDTIKHFDYFSWWTEGAILLHDICNCFRNRVNEKYDYVEQDWMVVGGILQDASVAEDLKRPLESAMIGEAASMIDKHIEQSGNHFHRDAKERALGWLRVTQLDLIGLDLASQAMAKTHPERFVEDGKVLASCSVRASGPEEAVQDTLISKQATVEEVPEEEEQVETHGPGGWPVE